VSKQKAPSRPLPGVDKRGERGAFDIIGDVHGCAAELAELLAALGYSVHWDGDRVSVEAPPGRRVVFVGDFVDRGPDAPGVMRIVVAMVEAGQALAVIGNHDDKFLRWLKGHDVKLVHGLQHTAEQYAPVGEAERARVRDFLDGLPSHLRLDGGELVVAHAGIKADMIGRNTKAVRQFCLYGDTSGKLDANGLPERFNWGADYEGSATVVYGHTPVADPAWQGNSVCIDTGCVFGGKLTALRWPEKEIVSVPAHEDYAPLRRGFGLPPVRPS
jgi:diadenosine tetraphosphatase ApaH/serine/threonine PP2A family protein phosphatase